MVIFFSAFALHSSLHPVATTTMAPPTKRSQQLKLIRASKKVRIEAVRTICDPSNFDRKLGQPPDFNKPIFWPADMEVEVDEDSELEVEEAEGFTDI